MQTLINQEPSKKNYDFIDSIRCIAMIFIVAEHSWTAGGFSCYYGDDLYWSFLMPLQLTKFGTIAFFLLGGFLLSDKFTDYSPGEYFKRRISNTLKPWLFWSCVYIIIDTVLLFLRSQVNNNNRFNFQNIFNNIKGLYLYSNYWFIINFISGIAILLIFRRYLYSFYLGAILLIFSLFYSINIYHMWIPTRHTTAIMGFVFFLWLGAQLRKYWQSVENLINKTSFIITTILVAATYYLAIREAINLDNSGVDPTNTLRFSNILYSLACFIFLLKIKSFKLINYLKPRQTTFGIYLIHFIIIVFLTPLFFKSYHIYIDQLTSFEFMSYRLSYFLITYSLTFFIVLMIGKSEAKKLIGN